MANQPGSSLVQQMLMLLQPTPPAVVHSRLLPQQVPPSQQPAAASPFQPGKNTSFCSAQYKVVHLWHVSLTAIIGRCWLYKGCPHACRCSVAYVPMTLIHQPSPYTPMPLLCRLDERSTHQR